MLVYIPYMDPMGNVIAIPSCQTNLIQETMHWLLDLHAVAVAAAPRWGRLQTSNDKRKPAAQPPKDLF